MNDTRVSSKHTGFTNFIWKGKYNFFIKEKNGRFHGKCCQISVHSNQNSNVWHKQIKKKNLIKPPPQRQLHYRHISAPHLS